MRDLGPYMAIGWVLMVSVLGGTLGGAYLDRRFESTPWLTLLGIFLGMSTGFVSLFKTLHEQERLRRKSAEDQGTESNGKGS